VFFTKNYIAIPLLLVIGAFGIVAFMQMRRMYFHALAGASLLSLVFFFAYGVGSHSVTLPIPTHTLNDSIDGQLIRAGERGILFASKGVVTLYRWDGIKSIKTIILSDQDRQKNMRHMTN
jgi:hypothetical protein